MSWKQHILAVSVVAVAATGFIAPAAQADPGADLSADLTSTPYDGRPGETVTHRVTVRNGGTADATTVRLQFTSSIGLEAVTTSTPQGTCQTISPQEVVCDLGTVRHGQNPPIVVTVVATLSMTPPPGGLVRNNATVVSTPPDAAPLNDVSTTAYVLSSAPDAPGAAVASGPPDAARSGSPGLELPNQVAIISALLLVGTIWITRLRFRYQPRHRRPVDWRGALATLPLADLPARLPSVQLRIPRPRSRVARPGAVGRHRALSRMPAKG